jgi:hypothetical protein
VVHFDHVDRGVWFRVSICSFEVFLRYVFRHSLPQHVFIIELPRVN